MVDKATGNVEVYSTKKGAMHWRSILQRMAPHGYIEALGIPNCKRTTITHIDDP